MDTLDTAQKPSPFRWVILFLSFYAIFAFNYLQFQLSPIAVEVMERCGLTLTRYSSLFTSTMLPPIFIGIFSGTVVDSRGLKVPLKTAMIFAFAGGITFIFARSYVPMFIGYLLIGVGTTFVTSNIAKICSRWFPPARIPVFVGIIMAASRMCQIIGMASPILFKTVDSALVFSGSLAAVCCVLWLILFREGPGEKRGVKRGATEKKPPAVPAKQAILEVLKCKSIWPIAICSMCHLAATICISSMLPTALRSTGYTIKLASSVSIVYAAGSFIGTLTLPSLIGRFKRQRPLYIIAGIVAALGMMFGWRSSAPIVVYVALFLTGYMIGGVSPSLMSLPIQLPEIGTKLASTASGLVLMIQLLGASVIPSYVFTPICGSNYSLFFILGGLVMILFSVSSIFLPVSKRFK